MATIERIEPAYTPWTPTASGFVTEDENYLGRHRMLGRHLPPLSLRNLRRAFYVGRHRRG